MNYTQNQKISQVTEATLIVGVDIGSETNFARAFNWRGQELSKKVFHFSNSLEGFQSFLAYLNTYTTIASAKQIIVGCEPTGHYWFNLARYLEENNIKLALVNPYAFAGETMHCTGFERRNSSNSADTHSTSGSP